MLRILVLVVVLLVRVLDVGDLILSNILFFVCSVLCDRLGKYSYINCLLIL